MPDKKNNFPGEDLVQRGLRDLSEGNSSLLAFLVLIGAPRLRRLGISIPGGRALSSGPEHALYHRLQTENPETAHSRYNAFIRRLVSYERALEQDQRHRKISL